MKHKGSTKKRTRTPKVNVQPVTILPKVKAKSKQLGVPRSEETKAKISATMKIVKLGHKHSAETRAKIGETMRRKYAAKRAENGLVTQ